MTDRIAIGIAAYGTQPVEWWADFSNMCATFKHYDIELGAIYTAKTMLADSNRNQVVKMFMKSTHDWLLWVDTDNTIPPGGVRRLLDTKQDFVSGLYYLKHEPYTPVAYWRQANNRYEPIHDWNQGEILPVACGGMGAVLTHRSVFEKIEKQFEIVQIWDGALITVHKDDIRGSIPKKIDLERKPKILDGYYTYQVHKPDFEVTAWPHFRFEHGRTEDMIFYENALRAGIQPFVDTSVEVGHIGQVIVTGEKHRDKLRREWFKYAENPTPLMGESFEGLC
ncbi:MAG: hypothetical protein WC455_21805 [Dehalococcoidia bacterium]|jgi:hypothetical protein